MAPSAYLIASLLLVASANALFKHREWDRESEAEHSRSEIRSKMKEAELGRNYHHARLGQNGGKKSHYDQLDEEVYNEIFGKGDPRELPEIMQMERPKKGEDYFHYINRITTKYSYNISLMENQKWPEPEPQESAEFKCPKMDKSPTKPTSVHALRPSDVNIVAAMGDSLTAAFGAKSHNALDLLIEFRGISWSIGGSKDIESVKTLANIFKYYNKDVKGYSIGNTPPKYIKVPSIEQLNVAVSGAVSYNLTEQAKYLIKQMRLQTKYDFFNDWKVLTVFIGGNDLCASCKDGKVERYLPENFIREVRSALDVLHKQVPKMFVNLVTPPDVPLLQLMNDTRCNAWHYVMCKCGTVYGPAARELAHQRWLDYNKLEKDLIDSGRYDTRDDFTVVLQPFFTQTTIPETSTGLVDQSYFAPDCFHFSGKAHAASALALWNSMIEPVGDKKTRWAPGESFECPSKDMPYLYTSKNSKKAKKESSSEEEEFNKLLKETKEMREEIEKFEEKKEIEVVVNEKIEIVEPKVTPAKADDETIHDDNKEPCSREIPFHLGVRFVVMYGVIPLLAFALILTVTCYVSKMGKEKKTKQAYVMEKQPYMMEVTMDAFEYEDKQRLI